MPPHYGPTLPRCSRQGRAIYGHTSLLYFARRDAPAIVAIPPRGLRVDGDTDLVFIHFGFRCRLNCQADRLDPAGQRRPFQRRTTSSSIPGSENRTQLPEFLCARPQLPGLIHRSTRHRRRGSRDLGRSPIQGQIRWPTGRALTDIEHALPVFGWNAGPVVFDANADPVVTGADRRVHARARPLRTVVDDVAEDLVQVLRITGDIEILGFRQRKLDRPVSVQLRKSGHNFT
jgi:hypothetical protein